MCVSSLPKAVTLKQIGRDSNQQWVHALLLRHIGRHGGVNTAWIFMYSYSDTEQYEEAVRDYEKVCKMEKTRGMIDSYSYKWSLIFTI